MSISSIIRGAVNITSMLLVAISAAMISCNKDISCETCGQDNGSIITDNRPPVAVAGSDLFTNLPADSVLLDGRASNDPDGRITRWEWRKISGPVSFSLSQAGSATTVVNNLVLGVYLFELSVTDDKGARGMDTVQVNVDPPVSPQPVDIYVAGMENNSPLYWKNGQAVTLPVSGLFPGGEASATSIIVVGNDVYVAGEENGGLFNYTGIAVYWKNGQEFVLTAPGGAASTRSITVAGNDVYVAGFELQGSKAVAKYWKNGQPFALTNGVYDAEATAIRVVNNDVYVSGYENGVAKYWKNGQPVALTNGVYFSAATSILVVNNDIYVTGHENGVVKYWKNGQPVQLSNGNEKGTSTSIAVSGNDVYVAGHEGSLTSPVAKYWKNGVPTVLSNNGISYAHAIAVYNTEVFVAGYDNGTKYWHNGQAVTLTTVVGSTANSIFVVRR